MPKGGKRPGAGRPLTAGELRTQRQMRATTEEWRLIQRFERLVKYGDKAACVKFVESAESQKGVDG